MLNRKAIFYPFQLFVWFQFRPDNKSADDYGDNEAPYYA